MRSKEQTDLRSGENVGFFLGSVNNPENSAVLPGFKYLI